MTSRILDRIHGAPLLRIIGTLLSLILLVYLLSKQGWAEIGSALIQIPLWKFTVALVLTIVSRLATGVRWHILIHAIDKRISLRDSLRLTFAGLFASNFLPTTIGGDVVRLTGMIQLKLDGVLGAASLIMDRLVGTVGMAMVLPFGLPGILESKFIDSLNTGLIFDDTPSAALTVSPLGVLFDKASKSARQLYLKLVSALSKWLLRPVALIGSLLFTWIHMLCLFWSMQILSSAMGERVSFWSIAGLWSMVYFVTLIPISINGYGVQELSVSLFFSEVGGISSQHSLTLAVLIRTLQMAVSLPGALYVSGTILGNKSNPHEAKQD